MIGRRHLRVVWLAALLLLTGCMTRPTSARRPGSLEGDIARIGILETTDLHAHVLSYDQGKPDPDVGLERTATLIRAARKAFANTLLFDDGDTIHRAPRADNHTVIARSPCKNELAIYKAMDSLHYDAGTIGNHEFDDGLDYLSQVTGTPFHVTGIPVEHCQGPHFPLVLSNVFSLQTGKPLYTPWRVMTRIIKVRAPDGKISNAKVRIGIVGFTPPPVMLWDRDYLAGKVKVMDVVEAANKYVPAVRAAGADIVIALLHGGIDPIPYKPMMENPGIYLAGVPGIDVILLGHQQQIFPDPGNPASRYNNLVSVDNFNGDLRGVPAVMGDYDGKALGVVNLALVYVDGHWRVDRRDTHSGVLRVRKVDGSYVAPDRAIEKLVAPTPALPGKKPAQR